MMTIYRNRLEKLIKYEKLDRLTTSGCIELEKLRSKRIKFPITFDGYCVIYPNYTGNVFNIIQDWISENCIGSVCSDNYGNNRLFVFQNVEDSVAFKLRWV